jgi:RsiW-degrading membrane proteinase PrsW (M82 family)
MANISIIFLSFFLPFLWFYYFYRKDTTPEPKSWIFLAFLLGALSVFPAYYLQKYSSQILNNLGLADGKLIYFLFAFFEEFFKFVFVWLIIFRSKVFDHAIDAVIYLTASAFGFSSLENLGLYLGYISNGSIDNPWSLAFFRFLGANFLHILASALIGFGYAEFVATRRIFPFIFSFLISTLLHFWYNVLVLNGGYFVHALPLIWSIFPIILVEIDHLKLHHGIISRRRK